MTYEQLMTAMKDALAPRVAAMSGSLEEAENPEAARAFLDSAPSRWRLILVWEGYGEHSEARMGMIVHNVATVIQAPRGLAKDRKPTTQSPSGSPAFSGYINAVNNWITAMRFPDGTEADVAGFAPAGSLWVPTVPSFAAHVLNWKLDAALPPFQETIALNFPHLTP
jgi:hypothetical protein